VKYQARDIPEGINVTKVHPLRELAVLLGGAAFLLALLIYVLGLSAGHLARYIPFDLELDLASRFPGEEAGQAEVTAYLEQLAERVTDAMGLPDGMTIRVRYTDADTVNAFATLGGNVVLFRGLLEKLPSENALAMLLAHEIAHVKHRDPIVSAVRGLTVYAVLTLVLGQGELDALGHFGLFTVLHFSREMERDADRAALDAVNRLYGHTRGAEELFHVIHAYREEVGEKEGIAFLQTHPLDQERIDAISTRAEEEGWARVGGSTPIPSAVIDAMSMDSERTDGL